MSTTLTTPHHSATPYPGDTVHVAALPTTGVTIVTGTDTDVGKTVFTAVLAAALIGNGHDVAVVKPAQTGLEPSEQGSDVDIIGDLAGIDAERRHEYVRLPEPLAPTTAARRAGVALPTVAEHARRIALLAQRHESVLVEGAGGILVGLDSAGHGLLQLADALRGRGVATRFVVVTRAGLGTLNHSALTCRAIRAHGHDLAGLVVGSCPPAESLDSEDHLAERCNLAELADVCAAPLLCCIPQGIGADPTAIRDISDVVPLMTPTSIRRASHA
ncbi:ATP-dependent dethiobiotin synthetase BioD [Austwickia sp. TVS 96-490-7B]|uniref:dethiobiotin synthase n=1 Tax=Austwickia sp. TVS 96-490-7B TaxID=2830843 RepID=UPI001C587F62|nr:dethiobiotin synthase [Austwickia sp. TVS 96-490-7B]MBW3085268.1 ATP-dependent dethiobiotin synthetase BioD [Austwickia sp. TVS 96-490-7B]